MSWMQGAGVKMQSGGSEGHQGQKRLPCEMFIFWTVAWFCFFTVSGSRHLQLHSSVRNHCGIFLTVDVLQDLGFVCEVQSTIFSGEACGVNCGYFAAFQSSTSIVLQAL